MPHLRRERLASESLNFTVDSVLCSSSSKYRQYHRILTQVNNLLFTLLRGELLALSSVSMPSLYMEWDGSNNRRYEVGR